MKQTYQYRLRPNKAQAAQMADWVEMLRRQYNYRLWQKLDWWEHNRCSLFSCSLVSCSIAEPRERPDYYWQKRDLLVTKQVLPEYAEIYSQVLQDCIGRVKKTFDRYTIPDKNGNRSGKPRYKKYGRYRSFTYPQMKASCIQGNRITLPMIGDVKIILHSPIPDGFTIKTATIVCKAGHWYVNLVVEDESVPDFIPDIKPTDENTVGIDLGLKSFLVTSVGEEVDIPQHYRKTEEKLARHQRKFSKTKKGSKRRRKKAAQLAKIHRKIANKRRDFHHKVAKRLVDKYEVIAHEDLSIKNMSARSKPKQGEDGKYLPNGQSAKSGLNKSILDAGWGQFLSILSVKASRAGRITVAVNPKGTSQICSGCDTEVPKLLEDRWHSCPHCGCELDRDHNAAKNVKRRALGHRVRKARKRKLKREAPAVTQVRRGEYVTQTEIINGSRQNHRRSPRQC